MSCGTTRNSAGPPIRSEVWKLSGSLNLTAPAIRPSIAALFPLSKLDYSIAPEHTECQIWALNDFNSLDHRNPRGSLRGARTAADLMGNVTCSQDLAAPRPVSGRLDSVPHLKEPRCKPEGKP